MVRFVATVVAAFFAMGNPAPASAQTTPRPNDDGPWARYRSAYSDNLRHLHGEGAMPRATETIVCSNFSGRRIDWFPANERLISPQRRQKVEWNEDAIGGLELTITWSSSGTKAIVSTTGNVNDSGGVGHYRAFKLSETPERVSFAIQQNAPAPDDAVFLLTYFLAANRAVWTSHASEFLIFKGGMHAKTFVGTCK